MATEKSIEDLLEKGFETRNNTIVTINYDDITTEEFGTVKLHGTIPCFLPPEYYPEYNSEAISSVAQKVMDYFGEYNALPKSTQECAIFNSLVKDCTFYAYILFPFDKFQSEHGLLFTAMNTIALTFDDGLESISGFRDLGPPGTVHIASMIGKYLGGDETIENQIPFEQYPQLISLQNVARVSMDRCRKICPKFKENQEHFIQSLCDNFLGMTLLQMEDCNIQYTESVHKAIRIRDVATTTILEISVLLLELYLPDEIRQSFLFHEGLRHIGNFAGQANDLISIGKELKDELATNLIIKRARNLSMSLEKSFEINTNEIHDSLNSFICIGKTLRIIYPDSDELDQYLLLMGKIADFGGHLSKYFNRFAQCKISTKEI